MTGDNLIIVLGAIAGTLTGAIGILFKSLIQSKDTRINELVYDRDYWRDLVSSQHDIPSYEAWLKDHSAPERPGKA